MMTSQFRRAAPILLVRASHPSGAPLLPTEPPTLSRPACVIPVGRLCSQQPTTSLINAAGASSEDKDFRRRSVPVAGRGKCMEWIGWVRSVPPLARTPTAHAVPHLRPCLLWRDDQRRRNGHEQRCVWLAASRTHVINVRPQASAHIQAWLLARAQDIETPSKWATNSVPGPLRFTAGRVPIDDDAVPLPHINAYLHGLAQHALTHAITPHLGSGAAQRVEDGLILAAPFASPHPRASTLPAVLRAYYIVHRPFGQDVLLRSYALGGLYCLQTTRVARGDGVPDDFASGCDKIANLAGWMWTTGPVTCEHPFESLAHHTSTRPPGWYHDP
ncbi:hypothetical protein PsYK624_064050 [Phanerochaete sordida]|uniref:Uncharacterized protein n=1 Tax=Phanerochaete sordida TaxID=48140 RepID=A0A9P3G8K2_9APHY|nr:hypothetical protein PsYK624_064050 [Phanerochaete sordida]